MAHCWCSWRAKLCLLQDVAGNCWSIVQFGARMSDVSAGADSSSEINKTHCDHCKICKHVMHCNINANETDQMKTSDFEPL